MDRQIVYPGSIPLDTDFLQMQRNVMAALGVLARCVLGTGVVAEGLACAPAGAGFGVVVGPGSLSTLAVVDATPYGSLAADAGALVKIAHNPTNTTLAFTGPADGDHAVCWLIQAQAVEFDTGPVALPYYNAADPAVTWSGPLNSGAAQNTKRVTRVALAVKPGEPRTVGDRFPPPADPGWVGLFSVMSYFGQATVPVDIAVLPGGPFVPFTLPRLFPGFSRMEAFAQNTVWRAPGDVRSAKVRLVGAGAGGGGGDTNYAGGGGGAGGYAEAMVAFAPGSTVTVAVGIGGAGGGPRNNGVQGGGSSFGLLVTASGGNGGESSNPNSAGGAGGTGQAGLVALPGGDGGDGLITGSGPGGAGGASAFGGGGRSAFLGGAAARGQAAGSGAGGGYGPSATGGVGANGLVIVEY